MVSGDRVSPLTKPKREYRDCYDREWALLVGQISPYATPGTEVGGVCLLGRP